MRQVRLPLILATIAALAPAITLAACGSRTASSGQLGTLDSVAMVSASDGWAVGTIILHFDGHQWQRTSDPVTNELVSVAMVSSSDGWAAGDGVFLHFDGHNWKKVYEVPNASLSRVFMLSATDGWAVGATRASNASPAYALLLHYDGTSWQQVALPQRYESLEDTFMVSPSEGWAVGLDQTSHVALLHFHHAIWSQMPLPPDRVPPSHLWMVSSTDGWLTGQPILHYQGGAWSPIATPSTGLTGLLRGIDMVSSSQGWAVGDNGILRYADGMWSIQSAQRVNRMAGVAMLSNQDGWAAGTYTEVGDQVTRYAIILHYDGSSWTQVKINS